MYRHMLAAVVVIVLKEDAASAPPPLRLTIDCGPNERNALARSKPVDFSNRQFDVNSFCGFIQSAIPKAVKDGKFILREEPDQIGFSNNQVPFAVSPPKGFIPGLPKLKRPRVKVPKLTVPKLRSYESPLRAPRVGSPMRFNSFRDFVSEDSSAERMAKFKKGVQKMLHVVKVLGQIDQYLSERTRIIIDTLSKTLAE